MSRSNKTQSAILALWTKMTPTLQAALYGAFTQHGIVSSRKAIAAIRCVDDDVRHFLLDLDSKIAHPSTTEGGTCSSITIPSSQDSLQVTPPSDEPPTTFKCSPCVEHAAQSFLNENEGCGPTEEVNPKSFFIRLVRVSTGEFMHWWRAAGVREDVVASRLLLNVTTQQFAVTNDGNKSPSSLMEAAKQDEESGVVNIDDDDCHDEYVFVSMD